MASSACNNPEPEESSFSAPIIARLTVHIATQGKKKKTIKKDTKTKDYLEFLTTILTKHHIGNKL